MLNIGDRVFIPNYGAGIVSNIEYKKIYDILCKFVVVSLVLDKMNLTIPMNKVADYKIRDVMLKKEAEEMLSIIGEKPEKIEKKWGKRYRQNNLKLSEGNLSAECEVLRDLFYLKKNDMLPPGEQKILDKAESLVVSEIMLIYDIDFDEACNKIRNHVR